ncbi:unnamed protein product, partial [Oppiella nova]
MPKQCNHMLKTKAAEPPRRCKLGAIEGSVKCSVHKGKAQSHTQGKGKEGKGGKTKAAKHYGVCTKTLLRWEEAGKIKVVRSPGGQRLYDLKSTLVDKEPFIYVRVSSYKQKNDLQRQEQYLLDKYPRHSIVKDIGSGLNFKRKGLLSLLEQSERGLVQEVVVASKDRLCRFGFDLLAWHFERHGVNLVVCNEEDKS